MGDLSFNSIDKAAMAVNKFWPRGIFWQENYCDFFCLCACYIYIYIEGESGRYICIEGESGKIILSLFIQLSQLIKY